MDHITENVKIIGTSLGIESHGIFTCNVKLEGSYWVWSFGGYRLDKYDPEKKKCIGTAYGLEFIKSILEVLEIDLWENLTGTSCRIVRDGSEMIKIGHFYKDKWFDPSVISGDFK